MSGNADEFIDKARKILSPHAAIRVQQDAEFRRLITHGAFVQKAVDACVVPLFIDYFGFVRSHDVLKVAFTLGALLYPNI